MRVEVIDIGASADVPATTVARLVQTQLRQRAVAGLTGVLQVQVPEHGAGILWIDGKVERLLTPGSYAYWKFNRNVAVEAVDLRLQAVEVTGQDILTRDKIGLRLNLSATWRYADVLKAFTQLAKPAEHLYRESARPRIARRRDAKVRLPEPKEMSIAAEGASFAPSPCIPRHV